MNNLDAPTKPDLYTGQKLISTYNEELKELSDNANAPKKGFFGKLDSVFSNVKNKITKGAKELDDKYDIKGKGEMALMYAKVAGDKIVEKGKEIAVFFFLNTSKTQRFKSIRKKLRMDLIRWFKLLRNH